ncbi:MAG: hypothetical protein IRY99_11735, partial [Isosphaeraceae bacterium]|nr:hypothetical protein [Isosphaeraceae bacterium]
MAKSPVKAAGVAGPEPSKPALRISPAIATLEPGDPGLQLLVEGEGAHGGKRDLIAQVRWETEPEGIVTIEAGGFVRPIGAGRATIRGAIGPERVVAEVTVKDSAERPWDFAA